MIRNIDHKFPKGTKCLLMIEFDTDVAKSQNFLQNLLHGYEIIFTSTKNSEIEKWWTFRDSALFFTLKNIPKNLLIPHVIEDATVPTENLKFIIPILEKITKKNRLNMEME